MKVENCQHFSHKHILIPLKLDEGEKIYCKACELLIIEPFLGCLSCTYYLHDHCLNTPRSLQHPSHPDHPLTLLPIPTYPTGAFSCNGCGSHGTGFSYSCAHCEFDLHMNCALFLSATTKIVEHPHALKLIFNHPQIFACNICGAAVDKQFWSYYCSDCDFGIHLGCTKHGQQHFCGASSSRSNNQSAMTQPSGAVDAVDRHREVMNETTENQLALLTLQNQIHYSQAVADHARWECPRH
ncbi:uncharacterized protein LOC113759445 [Coffea eugenioides]|uniref:uncharacterized protein LOC113759445 n=1 Tax=Coffea eugenioides TaxID=49369 RepID=UPI000F608B0B|nr:uncharacterized protein LOC113759445 [Coffea eugenioides]